MSREIAGVAPHPAVNIVLWHAQGDTSKGPLFSHFDTARTAVGSLIRAVSHGMGLTINAAPSLSNDYFKPDQPAPNSRYWTAYTCERDTAQHIAILMRFNYAVFLGWNGDNAIRSRYIRALEHDPAVNLAATPPERIIGRLVFPDVQNNVLPGTFWLPTQDRLEVPSRPQLPPRSIST